MALTGIKTLPTLRGTVTTLSYWNILFGRANWRVYPYQLGAMVRTGGTVTALALDGLGQIQANDYLMLCSATAYGSGDLFIPQTGSVSMVSAVSATDDAVTLDSALTVVAGDYMLNLGADTMTDGTPDYDGSLCYLKSDPAGNEDLGADYLTSASNGEFLGWVADSNGDPAFVKADLLLCDSSGTPQIVRIGHQLEAALR